MPGTKEEVTDFIQAMEGAGDLSLSEQFSAVYAQLHKLAHQHRRRWHGQKTLSTTVLMHEAYLKLSEQTALKWESRGHFFRIAAQAMRHILINYAERSRTAKRGGHDTRVAADEVPLIQASKIEELLAVDQALSRLEELSPRQARVVECRFFAGLEVEETAEALGISPITVMRDWKRGRSWLYRRLQE